MITIVQDMKDDINFLSLNYIIRLISTTTDKDTLISTTLDHFSDIGKSDTVKFFLFDEREKRLQYCAGLANRIKSFPGEFISYKNSAFESLLQVKQPTRTPQPDGSTQVCFPLLDERNAILGFLLFVENPASPLQRDELQILTVLSTMISISLEKIEYSTIALYDGLTGLFVRRHFNDVIHKELQSTNNATGKVSLILFDIDHFKTINDTQGHMQGDIVLRDVGRIIRNGIRQGCDIPCRFGGDEMAIILPQTSGDEAFHVAERIRLECEVHLFSHGSTPFHVTLSGGVTETSGNYLGSAEELIRTVDDALYAAKQNGRNRIDFLPMTHTDKFNISGY